MSVILFCKNGMKLVMVWCLVAGWHGSLSDDEDDTVIASVRCGTASNNQSWQQIVLLLTRRRTRLLVLS